MDNRRFDAMVKGLAGSASRRTVFGGLAGGGLAALLAALGFGGGEAAARHGQCRDTGQQCCRKYHRCKCCKGLRCEKVGGGIRKCTI